MKYMLPRFFLFLWISLSLISCKDDDSDGSPVDPTAENKKALGVSAEDLLSDDIYKKLRIELVTTTSYQPEAASIQAFRNFISERVFKPGGIQFIERQIPDQAGAPFSLDKIKEFEEEFRTQYTLGNDIAVYIFFSNGSSTNDTQSSVTLGTAYRNTSIVIYQKTLEIITQAEPELLPLLEQTTLEHEFGHILGLVNLQNDDIHSAHEDPNSAKHCVVEECLMYFDATNVGRSALSRLFTRGVVPQLDPLCIADLQAKGGK
jgi:hypothetical protein